MKTITATLLLGTALVAATTAGFAVQYNVYVTGTIKQYTHRSSDTTVIALRPFNNSSLIVGSTTRTSASAHLIYQDTGTGTNLFLIVDYCGTVLATNALLFTGQACGGQAANGYLYEQVCFVPIQLFGGGYGTPTTGGYAYVITDTKIQPAAHTINTNFYLRASGVIVNGDGDSGSITFSATTLFKPAKTGCP